ncbi:MAG: glycoside hydrolase family 3 C-terminal domain-containing protein [Elusimicrobia bacterium]|nr:glycoside hydrolase family 3 C-terminal domain-containing protein [Elusimicrobiota bacterium]
MKKILILTLFLMAAVDLFAGDAGDAGDFLIRPGAIEEITASSENGRNKAGFALDSDPSTRWESAHDADPSWIMIKFRENVSLSAIKIIWETASAKKYTVQVSDNAVEWKDVAEISDGKENEKRVISFKPVNSGYIRILCSQRTTSWGYSIWEIVLNPDEAVLPPYDPHAPYTDRKLPAEVRVDDLISRMSLKEKLSILGGDSSWQTGSNQRLRIPCMRVTDGPHGVGGGSRSTCFPTGISIASTWDEELVYRIGEVLGRETRANGKDILLGPCVNIHRTPLGGRNFESYSEDPFLSSRMAVAYVKGVQSQGIGTSTKHFACNNQEWDRNNINVEVDERALREIYLPSFKAAVKEAGTLSIMGAYNRLRGEYCCENRYLLTDILKNEWGFDGFVISDWGAVYHGPEAFDGGCDIEMPGPGKFFNADRLLPLLENGEIDEKLLDDKVRRILRAAFILGLFDSPSKEYRAEKNTPEHKRLAREAAENSIILLKNDKDILPLEIKKVKKIAVIGPNAAFARLGGGGSSTVYPPYTVSPLEGLKNRCGGGIEIVYAEGCSFGGNVYDIPLDMISYKNKSGDIRGYKAEFYDNISLEGKPKLVRNDKNIQYAWGQGSPSADIPIDGFSARWSCSFYPSSDGKYIFGLSSDDGSRLYVNETLAIDNWGDHGDSYRSCTLQMKKGIRYDIRIEYYENSGDAIIRFGMDRLDEEMLEKAVAAAKDSDIALVFAGLTNAFEGEGFDKKDMFLTKAQDDLIKAVASANGNTVVILINGSPVDMSAWIGDIHALVEAWYPGQEGGSAIAAVLFGDVTPSGKLPVTFPKIYGDTASSKNYPGSDTVRYEEGIFIGYRHFDKNGIEPLFPFGYGLSYTGFRYSDLKITPDKKTGGCPYAVDLDVENTGEYEGKEVVQLYVSDTESSLPRPVKELKGFKKVNLKPGEKKTITFLLDRDAFSYYDPGGKSWIAEPGKFVIMIGSSSSDIRISETLYLE